MRRAAGPLVLATIAVGFLAACHKDPPAPDEVAGGGSGSGTAGAAIADELSGALRVAGEPARLVRCRPGYNGHVFIEVDTSAGTLRFGEARLFWQGSERSCESLQRRWGGAVRRDGSAYFRGHLAFSCGDLQGELALVCGHITLDEAAELDRNAAEARQRGQAGQAVQAAPPPAPGR